MSVISRTYQTKVSPAQNLRFSPAQILVAFIFFGTVYVIGMRLSISFSLPMWLDETWSAMIATRSTWLSFWHEAWLDCNPPLYYLFLAGWVHLFGDSNFMLRLPSSLFVIAAAILPLIWPPRGLNRISAWTFAALLVLWQPGLFLMLDARGYGLMILLSTASSLVVANMLERLSLQRAAAWVAFGTMMFLTHYYAAALIIGQGLVLLIRHRRQILTIWPVFPIASPGVAWFVYHLPRLKDYARSDVAWYDPTSVKSALVHLLYVLGAQNFIALGVIVLVTAMAVVQYLRAPVSAVSRAPDDSNLTHVVGAAGVGFAISIIVGTVQASLADRYFVPLVPPAMLALALVAKRCAREDIAALMLTFTFLLLDLNAQSARQEAEGRAVYGYEEVSDFVAAQRPDRLLFLWDHPATKIMDPHSLEAVGGFFLQRAGESVPVRTLVVPRADDPNRAVRAAALGKRPAVVWLYDTAHQSAAHDYPPTLETDPTWMCRHIYRPTIRHGRLGAIGCVKLERGRD